MNVSSRISFGLGLFYLVAGFAYYFTGYEAEGFPLLLMAAAGITLLGAYAFLAVRKAERALAAEEESLEEVEPHVGPTIWPFGFAISTIAIVVGLLSVHWVLVLGGALFVAASTGWFLDVRRQWHHAPAGVADHGQLKGADTTPTDGESVT